MALDGIKKRQLQALLRHGNADAAVDLLDDELESLQTSSGIRTKRQTTGAVAAATTVDIVVTWPTAFADNAYTATVSLLEGTAGIAMRIRKKVAQTAASITVRVTNDDAVSALTGTIHAIAIHD